MKNWAAFLSLVIVLVGLKSTAGCSDGDLRLVGGSGSYEGNVQMCYDGEWGWVCDNSWGYDEARVVCRQLGFSTSNVVYRRYSFYGMGNGTIHLDYMYCNGNENKLIQCSHAYSIGVTYCGYTEMAGVFCPFGGGCNYGDIRLANFYTSSYGRSEGRVEVCYNNEWGTVCNSYWGGSDARVACRQLGYDANYYDYWSWSYFGYGSGNVWLNYLQCGGSESSLFSCSKSLGYQGCSHYYDVGVRCYSYDSSSCSNGEFRLWSAYDSTPANEGIPQICRNNRWYSICERSSCYAAKLICKSLGYSGLVARRYNGGHYYGYYYYNDNYYYECYSWHASLSHCYTYYWGCYGYYDSMGIKCAGTASESCDDHDIRLVGANSTSEGRVQTCYQGSWAPICDMDGWTASLVCKKLGFTDFSFGKIIDDERYGRSNIHSNFYRYYCYSDHTDLSDCYISTQGGCYESTCSKEYGIVCYDGTVTCADGDVRLSNGTIEQEGRPEICFNGIWATICDDSWNNIDGFVFCRNLGYNGPNTAIYYYSEFGEGYGPPVWSYVHCNGWEENIHDCSKTVIPNFRCYNNYVAGVTCKQSCEDGDVRLVGGGFDNEGIVEVCWDNLWGLISLSGWTSGDAKVVCNQLGHIGGNPLAINGSNFLKPQKAILLTSVSCSGNEPSLEDCTKTELSLSVGKEMISNGVDVAGVDCIYDEPTEPPCIKNPTIDPSDMCTVNGAFRLMNNGVESTTMGRFEYCHDGYWVPLCHMDGFTASVICKHLGFTQYTWGAVSMKGDFGGLLNYTLIENITCTGSESSLDECILHLPSIDCLPWCPNSNIGVRCYDSGICTEGDVRLADAVIEQEGRVEVCVNGVWGAVCDDGWDETDAHIVCKQLGYPDLAPYIFHDSYFSDGNYPIVYSELSCGGWEDKLGECGKHTYESFTCSRADTAGLLCGYDCTNGDVRLEGGTKSNEGTVEVCFNHLWGLISETGWSEADSQVVCKQLGYEVEGTVTRSGSYFGKPAKTIHLSNVECTGDEATIQECTKTSYSLKQGKEMIEETEVAGVTCYLPTNCVPPSVSGGECSSGQVKLIGNSAETGEGVLQYCYKGSWSTFCSLTATEATVACRQLGFIEYDVASVFNDGRFDSSSTASNSHFQNISCSSSNIASIADCTVFDKCTSNCTHPISIKCWTSANCNDGDVRLMNGSVAQEGRVEICHNNIWGTVCADGFNKIDGYVVCKELGVGNSEPTIYTNSYYGDGNLPIVYSNIQCRGYETSVLDCIREPYGEFSCSRDNVAGVVCKDACKDDSVRLVGSQNSYEGTVEICVDGIWGLVAVTGWNDTDAQVVCGELGFQKQGAQGVTDQKYGNPNKTVHLTNVDCSGTEDALNSCEAVHIPPEDGRELYKLLSVAGVSCKTYEASSSTPQVSSDAVSLLGGVTLPATALIIVGVFFLIGLLVVLSLFIVILRQHRSGNKRNIAQHTVTMSQLHENDSTYDNLIEDDDK